MELAARKILDAAFEALHRNGFFDQPRAVWEHQILNALRNALPELSQRPGNDAANGAVQAAPGNSQKRKRRVAQDDVPTRRSKRMRKPNKKYSDI